MTCNNPGCQACQKTSKQILNGELNKAEFQNCGYVIDFVDWLVSKNICNTSLNGHMKPLHEWACEFEHPAKKHNWCVDFEIIVKIKNNLVCAIQAGNELETLRQCLHILNWGFFYDKDLIKKRIKNQICKLLDAESNSKPKPFMTYLSYEYFIDEIQNIVIKNKSGNYYIDNVEVSNSMKVKNFNFQNQIQLIISLYFRYKNNNLSSILSSMNNDISILLSNSNNSIFSIFNNYININNQIHSKFMNAAITKIFAFLNCDGFIIYDSRVGAALGELIRIWANEYFEQSKAEIPDILRFYIPGDNTCNNRKPTGHIYCVDWKETHKEHYIANIKASWLVEMIRERVFDTFYLPCDCEAVDEICCLGDENPGCDCQNSTSGNASSYKKCKDVKFHQYIQTRAIESAFFVLGEDINGLDVR